MNLAILEEFEVYLQEKTDFNTIKNLYEPVKYSLANGGKRIRPLLCLLACEAVGGDYKKAFDAAMCVEVFHNFTLLHDDIIDHADIRRGKPSVPKKYGNSQAILSGDVMFAQSFSYLSSYKPKLLSKLLSSFTKSSIGVCEGQQLDIDFETLEKVSEAEYINMIRLKTAVLLGSAVEMGAICGEADLSTQENMYHAAVDAGIAFQLIDDYLDSFGDEKTFGKKIGGDILNRKKTFLWIYASNLKTNELQEIYKQSNSEIKLIKEVQNLYKELELDKKLYELAHFYYELAIKKLRANKINSEPLERLFKSILERNV